MDAHELVSELTASLYSEVEDPGAKLGDHGADQRLRHQGLARVRAALAAETLTADAAAHAVRAAAEDAVWLGASLADLSTVTGRSRQAARKRWPDLGRIHRRRKWLAYHVDDLFHAVGLLVERAEAIAPDAEDGFEREIRLLATDLDRSKAAFAAEHAEEQTSQRWIALDELVDVRLRGALAKAGTPTDGDAGFAVDGARGVLAHYDHATAAEQE